MDDVKLRLIVPTLELPVPFLIESVGYNPEELKFVRPEGYPHYHWLQTIDGEGEFIYNNQRIILRKNSGVFLLPNVPHSYKPLTAKWKTSYITFTGGNVNEILTSLRMNFSATYYWDEESNISEFIIQLLDSMRTDLDLTGLDASSHLYRFFTTIKKYGKVNNQPSISHAVIRLTPVIEFMDQHYSDPDIGLTDMAGRIGVSTKYLNTLFKNTFGLTAYAYFILLRMRKAKELIVKNAFMPIVAISPMVGFRDPSHFVATFRKCEGVTPEQYRKLFRQS